jgi:hypothetical protein
MRLAIEIKITGSTIAEITEKALIEWNRFSDADNQTLPTGSEIDIVQKESQTDQYNARVLIRTKVDNNG